MSQNKSKNKNKTDLILKIKEIIANEAIKTQQELLIKLSELGYEVNQTGLSRLLQNIGVIKASGADGELIYHLPWELSPPNPDKSLGTLVVSVEHNESMVVITTSPGAASLVARMLDYDKGQLDILGTIAGDDTIFVAPTSIENIRILCVDIGNRLS